MATLPKASRAVTVTGLGHAGRGRRWQPATTNEAAAAGVTAIPVWLPATVEFSVSRDGDRLVPAVLSVALKVWTPASAAVKV